MLFYSLKLSSWKGFLSREKRTKIPFIFSCKSPYHKDNVNPAFLGPALGITRESSQGTSAKRTCSLDISARCSPLGLRSSSRVCRNRYTIVRNWRNSWSHVITQMEELLKSYNNDKFLGEKRDSHSVFMFTFLWVAWILSLGVARNLTQKTATLFLVSPERILMRTISGCKARFIWEYGYTQLCAILWFFWLIAFIKSCLLHFLYG